MPSPQDEIRALLTEDSLDETLGEYMDAIVRWAMAAKERHNLSDEAVGVLLRTAPPPDIAFIVGVTRYLKSKRHHHD